MASQITESPSFAQLFVQTQINENIKAPCHWPLWSDSPVTGEFPSQRPSNAENVFIWRHHHEGLSSDTSLLVLIMGTIRCQAIIWWDGDSVNGRTQTSSPPQFKRGVISTLMTRAAGQIKSPANFGNRLFRLISKEASRLRIMGPYPITGIFSWQKTNDAESVSMSWRHHSLTWPLHKY